MEALPLIPHKHKVLAYITHAGRLLVFRHPTAPEAGIQVPAGTVEPGEDPDAAVLREAREETGLAGLVLVRYLGAQRRERTEVDPPEMHHRRFYHLAYPGDPPATWRHWESDPSDGSAPVPFDFFWAPLPDGVPPLVADHGYALPALLRSLAGDGPVQ
ncbi:MAG TPA: NUDIX domain-containing protein [Chloroflexia bacterium]|nr:NUDIX domain-containing protein [Chloroflexia bacterium]